MNLNKIRTNICFGILVKDDLLKLAFTHCSYAHENGKLSQNERLEFLGDSVLGMVITEYLYRSYPDLPEGELAKRKAKLISKHTLAEIAAELSIGEHILLGHGELQTHGNRKPSIF